MKILYLYAEVMGYTMATVRELARRDIEVNIIHWDHKKISAYKPPTKISNVFMYDRSSMTNESMHVLVKNISPDAVVISGWMDRGYLKIARGLIKKGVPVVMGLDAQWRGTFRQRILCILGAIGCLKKYYSHAWVAGIYQYEYAQKLGFQKSNIVNDLYSADLTMFDYENHQFKKEKASKYPHKFLFVGRLEYAKGLDVLISAWQSLGDGRSDWELVLIGDGSLKTKFENISGVTIKGFMQPEQLIQEVSNYGCFLLPSSHEPWGVVVHELAAAGLPLILSEEVGAASVFLIPGFNGYRFKTNNAASLESKMKKIIALDDSELYEMGVKSHDLSHRITPLTSANNLLSAIV